MNRGEVGIGNSHAQLSLPQDLYKWNKGRDGGYPS